MNSPKVSVLTIVRNGEATLPLALASLLRQSHQNWECIIINDASTDRTESFLSSLKDPRFRPYHSPAPLGRGAARNAALERATGEYITTLDADDFYFEQSLSQHVQVLEKDRALSLSSGSVLLFDLQRNFFGKLKKEHPVGEVRFGSNPSALKFPLAAAMIRKTAVGSNRYNPEYDRSEDREFFTRVLANKSIYFLREPTYAYRWQPKIDDILLGLAMREQTYRKQWRHFPFKNSIAFLLNRLKIKTYQIVAWLQLWPKFEKLKTSKMDKREEAVFLAELNSCQRSLEHLYGSLPNPTKTPLAGTTKKRRHST